jgi:hypothetical protein
MKKSGFFLLLILLLLIPACKSQPPVEEIPGLENAETPPEETDTGAAETAEPPAGETLVEETGDGGASLAENWVEPEPVETDSGLPPPIEASPPALPEPDAAALLQSPEPVPAAPVENAPAGSAAGSPPPVPEPVPPPAAESRPPRLRPAEEEPAAGIDRDPDVRPVPPPAPEPEISPLAPPLAAEDEGMVFSRIVRATVGQLVEIPFRGTGWVYLGELGARRGVAYDSRRLDPEGQSFIFRAEAAGVYALKFYKQDFIRDYILNDYVQVVVGEAPESSGAGWFNPPLDRGRVSAERWPSSLEEAGAAARSRAGSQAGAVPPADADSSAGAADPADAVPPAGADSPAEQPSAEETAGAGTPPPARQGISDEGIVPVRPPAAAGQQGTAVPETAPVLPEGSLPEAYAQRAQDEFDAGRVAEALAVLDQFRERFPAGSDEIWWLYGQFYEANSPSRNIRTALDYYRRLVREYPQSRRYNDARRRIAYLERYYINIQ